MGFPRQERWSGLPFPFPGDLPNPTTEPESPTLAAGFFTTEPPAEPILAYSTIKRRKPKNHTLGYLFPIASIRWYFRDCPQQIFRLKITTIKRMLKTNSNVHQRTSMITSFSCFYRVWMYTSWGKWKQKVCVYRDRNACKAMEDICKRAQSTLHEIKILPHGTQTKFV